MFERIIEIIVFVISELKQNKAIADISIDELHDLGYTSAEISTAFSWIVDRIDFSERFLPGTTTPSPKSFRILHADEKDLFTTDGWGEISCNNRF